MKFIKDLTQPHGMWRFWTGGYRDKDKWVWVTGSPVSSSMKIDNAFRDRMSMARISGGRKFYGEEVNHKIGGIIIEYSADEKANLTLPPNPATEGRESEPAMPESSTHLAGNPHTPEIPVRKSQTQINGLLVLPLGETGDAGAASTMTLSALRGDESEPASVQFNQPVGATMQKALEEVVKFLELRHDGWPRGRTMEVSFENKYNPKDGPSAAVACALPLESAIEGYEIDEGFAVTGDINADGSFQPVGGVDAKIRGADNKDCSHVAIPEKNLPAVYESVLLDGLAAVAEIQVFTISSFEKADALARTERDESIQQCMDQFSKISELYQKKPRAFARSLKHPKVTELLQEIRRTTPNHLSAEVLLKYATDQAPKTLSLHGSAAFIESKAFTITDVIKNGSVSQIEDLSVDQVSETISLLRRSREKLDNRVWDWANELINFGTLLNTLQTNPPNAIKNRNKLIDEINAAGNTVSSERRKLFSNPEVMEELIQQSGIRQSRTGRRVIFFDSDGVSGNRCRSAARWDQEKFPDSNGSAFRKWIAAQLTADSRQPED